MECSSVDELTDRVAELEIDTGVDQITRMTGNLSLSDVPKDFNFNANPSDNKFAAATGGVSKQKRTRFKLYRYRSTFKRLAKNKAAYTIEYRFSN